MRKESMMNLTVMEDFIPFVIAPNHVPPKPKREEEFMPP
jgi:hypothetical protein